MTAEAPELPKSPSFSVGVRRRTCVICGQATPNSYVTSFTRVPAKQEEWVKHLANGDNEYADNLKKRLATGRKYLCLDHFDRQQLVQRKTGDGLEVVKNNLPLPFKKTTFIRHVGLEGFSTASSSGTSACPPIALSTDLIPAKRQKLSNSLAGRAGELDPASMTFLMNTVNQYVTRAMEEADAARRKAIEEESK